MLRLAERVIQLSRGDTTRGNLFFKSPLALAIMFRGGARRAVGIPGWKNDYREAIAMARGSDAMTLGVVVFYIYVVGIPYGVFQPDATALNDTQEALERAQKSGDETTLAVARSARGVVLAYRDAPECDDGVALLAQVRDAIVRERFGHPMMGYVNIELARARARSGDLDGAIELVRPYTRLDETEISVFGLAVTVLVESLLHRGGDGDDEEVDTAIGDLGRLCRQDRSRGLPSSCVAIASADRLRPRRRGCKPGFRRAIPCAGRITWSRQAHRDGRSHADCRR
jgi:adenylate cyclase